MAVEDQNGCMDLGVEEVVFDVFDEVIGNVMAHAKEARAPPRGWSVTARLQLMRPCGARLSRTAEKARRVGCILLCLVDARGYVPHRRLGESRNG